MISFNILGNYGHLGNQMFQYASLKGISTSNQTDFVIPPKESFGSCYSLLSKLDDCFDLNCDRFISNFKLLEEKSFSFDETLMTSISEDVDLKGYFQSEKYFKNIKNEIKKDFSFKNDLVDHCLNFIQNLGSNGEVISLHIRRGDYLNLQSFHPIPPLAYYEEALNKLPQDLPVLIFSNDSDWCFQQELFDNDRFFISQSNQADFDMCLMSLCTYHIIANSSFSWWGAWLSKSKKVFAPKIWFGPSLSHFNTKDLYPNKWKTI
jgi:hypothetical protein